MEPLTSAFVLQVMLDAIVICAGSLMGIVIAEKVVECYEKEDIFKEECIPVTNKKMTKKRKIRAHTE